MGNALGENSPVILSLGRSNYESLISRHGQFMRWRVAKKCSCVSLPSMQPDIHCKFCSGRGYVYTFQKNKTVVSTVMLYDTASQIIELDEKYEKASFIKVYDQNGKEFPNAYKCGHFVNLNTSDNLVKGVYYTVVMDESIISSLDSANADKLENGFYRVPGITETNPKIDGIYYEAASDIVAIGKITDAAGIVYTPKEFRLDTFRIEETTDGEGEVIPITEPVTVENISYVKPFTFALLSQNLSESDVNAVTDVSGDGVLSFPYNCDVSNDDVLTVFTGCYTQKEVITRSDFETDTIGAFFVYDVVQCSGIQNGELYDYVEGKDFIIVGDNKIKWLETDNSIYPEAGEGYSITYHVLPTYRVVKQIPQLRTAENQRFPKKAVVKLFTSYSEKGGVNIQIPGRSGISGSK